MGLPLVNLDSVDRGTRKVTDVASVNGDEVVQIVGDLEVFDDFGVNAVARLPGVVFRPEPFPPDPVGSDCGGSLAVNNVVEEHLTFPIALVHVDLQISFDVEFEVTSKVGAGMFALSFDFGIGDL